MHTGFLENMKIEVGISQISIYTSLNASYQAQSHKKKKSKTQTKQNKREREREGEKIDGVFQDYP